MDEFALIEKLFAPLAADGALGLRDDAAILTPPPGMDLVLTKDAIVEDVHFRSADAPGSIAQKLQRVNLSDLAAKGAEPLGYLLATAFRSDMDAAWLEGFAGGLAADQKVFGWKLYGGDTVVTPGPLMFSLTAIGVIPSGQTIQRAGASAGDDVYVSGTIGDAGLGLRLLTGALQTSHEGAVQSLSERYLLPRPRLEVGAGLRGLASAAVDISDGLVADAGHLGTASGVSLTLELEAMPISGAGATVLAAQEGGVVSGTDRAALAGFGDDYELLFTSPPEQAGTIARLAQRCDVPLTRIGTVRSGSGVEVLHGGLEIDLKSTGYNHFRS